MMKALAQVYKGIEFVNVMELPSEQQFLLQANHQIERIKILMDGKIVSNCIQYKDYEAWFVASYEPFRKTAAAKKESEPAFSGAFALDKA